jgi:hypothetical protein
MGLGVRGGYVVDSYRVHVALLEDIVLCLVLKGKIGFLYLKIGFLREIEFLGGMAYSIAHDYGGFAAET